MQRFFVCGEEGLQGEAIPGRPSRLNELQKQELKNAVMNPPRFVGIHNIIGMENSCHIISKKPITLLSRFANASTYCTSLVYSPKATIYAQRGS
jgi:hypothetical protein